MSPRAREDLIFGAGPIVPTQWISGGALPSLPSPLGRARGSLPIVPIFALKIGTIGRMVLENAHGSYSYCYLLEQPQGTDCVRVEPRMSS